MHLAIAEPQYWEQFKESLAKPVQPDFKPQATDAAMLWYGIDRTQSHDHRRRARAARHLADREGVARRVPEAARRDDEDRPKTRRRIYAAGSTSTASQDLYQWFLMISTHSQRHILQIREVKAHQSYPKK